MLLLCSFVNEVTIYNDEKAETKFLTLSELGKVLSDLADMLPCKFES